MTLVRRFAIPDAVLAGDDVFIVGIGLFVKGLLDVPSTNVTAINDILTKIGDARISDLGQIDTSVSPLPYSPSGDPWPQYLQPADIVYALQDTTNPISQAFRQQFSSLRDTQNLPVAAPREGGGLTLFSYTYPTWGYGGSSVDKNAASPTLLDLGSYGVNQMFWFPGASGNVLGCADSAALSGVDGSNNPRVMTITLDVVTNEFDPIQGQSNYYVLAKPSCWLIRFREDGFIEFRVQDGPTGTSAITFVSTITVPVKSRFTLQAILTPNDNGVAWVQFNSSPDGGQSWQQFGDVVYASRALAAYNTVSQGQLAPIMIGGNSTLSMFRGGLISAKVLMGNIPALDIAMSSYQTGATTFTDGVGNLFTVYSPQASNWVTRTCVAAAAGEYVTLTSSPTGQYLTSPGLYSTLTLSGFTWDLSLPVTLSSYRDSNKIVNTQQTPTSNSFDFYMDIDGSIVIDNNGVKTGFA